MVNWVLFNTPVNDLCRCRTRAIK